MSVLRHLPVRRRRFLALTGIVVVLGAALVYVTVAFERKREIDELRAMSDSLAAMRASADVCRNRLARQERSFRLFDARVDSLRSRVDAFEALDPDGVPSDTYEAYLDVFDRYNAAVEEWETMADGLRADETRCRALVERHNRMADSVKRRAEAWEAGRGR